MHPLAFPCLFLQLALGISPVDPPAPAPQPTPPAPAATDERLQHALALLDRLDEKVSLGEVDALTIGNVPTWLRLRGFPVQVDSARLTPRADMTAFEERVPVGETTYGALLGAFARAAGTEFDPWSVDSDGFTLLLLPESGRDRLALTAIYDVSLLAQHRASREVPQGDTTAAVQQQMGTIVDLLHEHVVPDGWTEMGGKLVSLREDGFDLIITGAPAVHRSIRELLRQFEIASGLQQVLVAAEVIEFPTGALQSASLTSAALDACIDAGSAKIISAPKLHCLPTGVARVTVSSGEESVSLVLQVEPGAGESAWSCDASIDRPSFKGQFRIPFLIGAAPTCAMMTSANGERCIALRLRATALATAPSLEPAK